MLKGRPLQSVALWCFDPMSAGDLAIAAKSIGIASVELVDPPLWPDLVRAGVVCAMTPSHGPLKGLNRIENHAECLAKIKSAIEITSKAGWPNVATFSGLREGLSDEEGIANTVTGIKQVIAFAETSGVTICLEALNSRINAERRGYPDYQCDRIEWAVEVCRRVHSPNMKVLFDLYHMQIMEGDLISRIREFSEYIGHYHTGGVPGRHELGNDQEINYSAVFRAIADTGFCGYVGHELVPSTTDKLSSLRYAANLCNVSWGRS